MAHFEQSSLTLLGNVRNICRSNHSGGGAGAATNTLYTRISCAMQYLRWFRNRRNTFIRYSCKNCTFISNVATSLSLQFMFTKVSARYVRFLWSRVSRCTVTMCDSAISVQIVQTIQIEFSCERSPLHSCDSVLAVAVHIFFLVRTGGCLSWTHFILLLVYSYTVEAYTHITPKIVFTLRICVYKYGYCQGTAYTYIESNVYLIPHMLMHQALRWALYTNTHVMHKYIYKYIYANDGSGGGSSSGVCNTVV